MDCGGLDVYPINALQWRNSAARTPPSPRVSFVTSESKSEQRNGGSLGMKLDLEDDSSDPIYY